MVAGDEDDSGPTSAWPEGRKGRGGMDGRGCLHDSGSRRTLLQSGSQNKDGITGPIRNYAHKGPSGVGIFLNINALWRLLPLTLMFFFFFFDPHILKPNLQLERKIGIGLLY